jgi:RNA polymerase sigma factor (sigma-70 family)
MQTKTELSKKELSSLRKESKNWSSKQWEEYLQSIECPRSESLLDPKQYKDLIETTELQYQSTEESDGCLDEILDLLPKGEKKALELIYWDDLSQREAAKVMGIERANLRSKISRALAKIKPHMTQNVQPTSRIMKGEICFLQNREEKNVQENSKLSKLPRSKTISIINQRRFERTHVEASGISQTEAG